MSDRRPTSISKAAELELRGRLVPTGKPGERRDPETGRVYYSSAWLSEGGPEPELTTVTDEQGGRHLTVAGAEHLLRSPAGEVVGMIEPRSALEALTLEPLEAFLAGSHRCPDCGEPVADDVHGVEVIWSGIPHDAMLCAYYRDLKAASVEQAEAELEAAGRRARREAGWPE